MRSIAAIEGMFPDVQTVILGVDGGAFKVPHRPTNVVLHVIMSTGFGWDHVSVSLKNRCPNWPEMEHVKRVFFRDDETAMQLHVPPAEHINHHPYTLHLWRPLEAEIQRPPGWMVAPEKETQ